MTLHPAKPEDIAEAREALEASANLIDEMQFDEVRAPAAVLLAGWLCAAAEQVRLILLAEDAGLNVAAAPARRLLLELDCRGWPCRPRGTGARGAA